MDKMVCDSDNFTITRDSSTNLAKAECEYDYYNGNNRARSFTLNYNDQ